VSLIGWWFIPGTPVSSTRKTYRHFITEILLKVALNTIHQTNQQLNPGTLVSATNKTDHHNISKMLLKVALNTIIPLNPD